LLLLFVVSCWYYVLKVDSSRVAESVSVVNTEDGKLCLEPWVVVKNLRVNRVGISRDSKGKDLSIGPILLGDPLTGVIRILTIKPPDLKVA
jgi:hypothetical protein